MIKARSLSHGLTNVDRFDNYAGVKVSPGEIKDCIEEECDGAIYVNTDSAVIAKNNNGIYSGPFFGCTALVISDGDSQILFHLTPKTKLSYKGWKSDNEWRRDGVDRTIETISRTLVNNGIKLSDSSFALIGEPGNSIYKKDKYSIQAQRDAFEYFKKGLLDSEFKEGKVVESPVGSFMVLLTPDRKNDILLVGNELSYDEAGNLLEDKSDIEEHWISQDTETKQDFGINFLE